LQASFPDKNPSERLLLEREFYHHFADMLVEIVYGYRISDEEMRQRVVFENVQLVEDLAHQTHGVVVYLGHMGNWEWIADLQKRFADKNMVEYNVYRQLKNPRSDQMMRELRAKRGGECVEKNQLLRKLVSLRKASHSYVLGMLADQKPSKRSSYAWTTFLNRETAFLNGGELLAKKFGLSAIYAHILCPKRGYYTVRFEAITADPNTMSEDQMTGKYAALLEQNIQQQPSQWLWTHNRWKWGRKELEG
jgi:KDO2-lipid IV(A) lauroyltransferase